jgi:hypothetical protein
LLKIFDPDAQDLISSGDEVSDKPRREMFINAYDEQHRIDSESDKEVLLVGKKSAVSDTDS